MTKKNELIVGEDGLVNGHKPGKFAKFRAKKGKGVGKEIVNLLLNSDKDYDEIATNCRNLFGGSTTKECVSWYMSKLKKGEYGGIEENHPRLA